MSTQNSINFRETSKQRFCPFVVRSPGEILITAFDAGSGIGSTSNMETLGFASSTATAGSGRDTVYYDIPATLWDEVDELESFVQRHLEGKGDAASLKARRVPFGCYEQRKDGAYMLRIRCPRGALTPSQLSAIATLSSRYGADHIHVTTRQEFQIHDLKLEDVMPVMRELLNAGLAARGGGGNTALRSAKHVHHAPLVLAQPDELSPPVRSHSLPTACSLNSELPLAIQNP